MRDVWCYSMPQKVIPASKPTRAKRLTKEIHVSIRHAFKIVPRANPSWISAFAEMTCYYGF